MELLQTLETENIANYTEAFLMAFQTLNSSRECNAAECNKAIMVISDGGTSFFGFVLRRIPHLDEFDCSFHAAICVSGAPENFEEIFGLLNPEKRVRIFTYVIGREVTVYDEMKSIACQNRGYVTHVSTMADVRNHVEVSFTPDDLAFTLNGMIRRSVASSSSPFPKPLSSEQVYARVLGRPMVLAQNHTNIYVSKE